ncbi:hypothetical protein ACFYO0_02665 [Streptomyces sp. NPDC006365]|uniref:hypothetical protein n=1 Tax=Streptomyces sp. NPDC006365 TaxID=3364744 RepID=UPI00367F91CE
MARLHQEEQLDGRRRGPSGPGTVRNHLSAAMSKLGAPTLGFAHAGAPIAAAHAWQQGWI